MLGLLERSRRDTTVVALHAPGGYGKTTILAQWAREDDRPVVWISVRPEAPDAAWLAQTVVDELHETGLLTEPVVLPRGGDAVAWHLGVLPAIEAAMSGVNLPFLLVIDDAGALSGKPWDCLAASIVTSLPEGAQLALGTRTVLPASLRKLRTEEQLLELGPDVLALDALEGAALLHLLDARVSDSAQMDLLEATEGWPVAVYLAGRAVASGRKAPVVGDLVPGGDLSTYLRDEILAPLDEADARFLLRSSVLTRLDERSCDAVAGNGSSLARLRRLATSNHLLVPLDRGEEQFRMHPVLREFLSGELRSRDPQAWQSAHATASMTCEEAGDLDEAVVHAREPQDDARLGALVWRHSGMLIGTGRMSVLRRWLDGVEPNRLVADGGLALVSSWLAAQAGDDVALGRYEMAAEACAVRQPDIAPDVALLKATMAREGIEEMRSLAREFTARASPDDPWLTVAYYLLGTAMLLSGHEGAVEEFQRGHRLAVLHGLPAMRARHLAALGELELMQGQHRRATAYVDEARELVSAHRLEHLVTITPVFVTSARCYLQEGATHEAGVDAARALRLMSLMPILGPLNRVYNPLSLAAVFLDLGDHQRAKALVSDATQAYGPTTKSPVGDRVMADINQRLRALSASASTTPMLSTAEIRVLQYLPTHLSFPEIAAELFVSRHTVKTQALAAYRKLGAHSRTEAINKAREAGLLPAR